MHWIRPAWTIYRDSREQMVAWVRELEAELRASGGPWLLGEDFTLADVGWAAILERFRQADCLDLFINERTPATRAYWQLLQHRAAYADAVLVQQHPVLVSGSRYIREQKARDPVLRSRLEGIVSGK